MRFLVSSEMRCAAGPSFRTIETVVTEQRLSPATSLMVTIVVPVRLSSALSMMRRVVVLLLTVLRLAVSRMIACIPFLHFIGRGNGSGLPGGTARRQGFRRILQHQRSLERYAHAWAKMGIQRGEPVTLPGPRFRCRTVASAMW